MLQSIAVVLAAALAVSAAPQSKSSSTSAPTFLGRVNPATRELTWPSTGIKFSFQGTSATVPITSVSGSNAVEIIIDGGAPIVIDQVTSSTKLTTPATLAQGQHTFELRKKSEALFGSIFIGQPTVSGKLTKTTAAKKRIEIVGDSISVGYGLDGTYPCTNTAAVEDGPKTYGALAAAALGYDYSIVAWSGKGVIRNYVTATPDNSPRVPQLWTKYGANDADNSYDFKTPVDVVVVNLGTNDAGYVLTNSTGQNYNARSPLDWSQYTTAIVKFGKQIQAKYPNAQLFLASSPMLSDYYPTTTEAQHTTQSKSLQSAAAQLGSKAHFVDFPSQDSTSLGCDYHPSASTHQKLAVILESAIKAVVK